MQSRRRCNGNVRTTDLRSRAVRRSGGAYTGKTAVGPTWQPGLEHVSSQAAAQRVAGARLRGQGSRLAGDPHRPRRDLAGRRTPRPRAPGGRGTGAVEDAPRGAQVPRRLAGAITLALLELEKSRDNQVGLKVAGPQPAARHGEPTQIFPANAALNAVVCSRVHELREALPATTIALEIPSRNARVAALQKRRIACAPDSS
jgi:hypothetical protein